jgi:predicted amidophosphoribosyltransferase
VIDLRKLDRPPAGFAACVECAYRQGGSAAICFACAAENSEPISENACLICDQQLKLNGECGNPICNWSVDDRFFEYVWAISMRTGQMKWAISRYKYDLKIGWAAIFGRILVGFLNENTTDSEQFDLIIPSPTFVGGDGGREFDHIAGIVNAAHVEEPLKWPFEFGVIEKTKPTERLVGHSWRERKEIAEGQLRDSLVVPDDSRVKGRTVLVVDDVFTEGFTIREVARALKHAGAANVCEVVLAREPWKG